MWRKNNPNNENTRNVRVLQNAKTTKRAKSDVSNSFICDKDKIIENKKSAGNYKTELRIKVWNSHGLKEPKLNKIRNKTDKYLNKIFTSSEFVIFSETWSDRGIMKLSTGMTTIMKKNCEHVENENRVKGVPGEGYRSVQEKIWHKAMKFCQVMLTGFGLKFTRHSLGGQLIWLCVFFIFHLPMKLSTGMTTIMKKNCEHVENENRVKGVPGEGYRSVQEKIWHKAMKFCQVMPTGFGLKFTRHSLGGQLIWLCVFFIFHLPIVIGIKMVNLSVLKSSKQKPHIMKTRLPYLFAVTSIVESFAKRLLWCGWHYQKIMFPMIMGTFREEIVRSWIRDTRDWLNFVRWRLFVL